MIITNLSVAKVAHDDPRYPKVAACPRPFTDVYLCTASTADGDDLECPFYVMSEMTAEHAANMLKLFANAVAEAGKAAIAA